MKTLTILFLSFLLFSCNKPDPTPELRDPIYQDMKAQEAITERNIAEVEKQLEEHKMNLKRVKPQTGQIKFAQKRLWETQNALDLLKQQKKYWEVRSIERIRHVRKAYLKAFHEGTEWPDQKEIEEYMAEKRLRQAKLSGESKNRYKKPEFDPTAGEKQPESGSSH